MGVTGWKGIGFIGGWLYAAERKEGLDGGDSKGEIGLKATSDKET